MCRYIQNFIIIIQKLPHLVPEYLRKFRPMPVLFIKVSMVTRLTRLQFILWSLKVPIPMVTTVTFVLIITSVTRFINCPEVPVVTLLAQFPYLPRLSMFHGF